MQYSPRVMISVRPTHYRTYKKGQIEQYDFDDDDDNG